MARCVVITGAGAGLGKWIAERLGADGENVVLLGRTLSKVEAVAQGIGANAMAAQCEMSDPASVRAAFVAIAQRHRVIDVLINNAAIYEPFMVEDASDEQITGSLLTNIAGPIYACRAAIPMMQAGGHIINISSESIETPFPMMSLYQASKAGLERFSKALKAELEERRIKVTVVRAGQMYDEGKTFDIPPEVGMRFHQECQKRGIDPRARGITHFRSVAELFHTLLNLPADLQTPLVTLESVRPG